MAGCVPLNFAQFLVSNIVAITDYGIITIDVKHCNVTPALDPEKISKFGVGQSRCYGYSLGRKCTGFIVPNVTVLLTLDLVICVYIYAKIFLIFYCQTLLNRLCDTLINKQCKLISVFRDVYLNKYTRENKASC